VLFRSQTAVMRKDFETADKVLSIIPKDQCTRVAHFLEKQGFKQQALAVTCDQEHKFELAIQLAELKIAYEIANESESEQKWKQLAEIATKKFNFKLAQECLHRANDFGSLVLLASAAGDASMIEKLGISSKEKGQNNISFVSFFTLGKLDECLQILIDTNRLPEAALFARTYLPSKITHVVDLWKNNLSKTNEKASKAIADPNEYENLFPGYTESLRVEKYLAKSTKKIVACEYLNVIPNFMRKPFEEMREAEESQESQYFDDHDEKKTGLLNPESEAEKMYKQNEETDTLKKANQITSQNNIDDLDLDLDIELPDIDSADVNLDDDLSD